MGDGGGGIDILALLPLSAGAQAGMKKRIARSTRRYLAIMLDGLRPAAATPPPVCAPDIAALERRARRRAAAAERKHDA